MNKPNKKSITDAEKKVFNKVRNQSAKAENKFPLVISLLVTFGFVSVLYGFEKIIDQISFLETNPHILLIIGLVVLALTGRVYQKLS